MCLVCVPLDVEDTLRCFRENLERCRHALLTFQHSRTLLHLLLADTQHRKLHRQLPFCILHTPLQCLFWMNECVRKPADMHTSVISAYVEVPFSKEPSGVLQGKVEFNLAASTPPGIGPLDLSNEDYITLGSIYSTTLPPSQIQTVINSYNNAVSKNHLVLSHAKMQFFMSRICSWAGFLRVVFWCRISSSK